MLGLVSPGLLLLALLVGTLSKQTHDRIVATDGAVILEGRVEVKGAPSQGDDSPDLFILHEGTVVEVLGLQDGWTRVRLANGNTGWIRSAAVEASDELNTDGNKRLTFQSNGASFSVVLLPAQQ